jgi:hypothetical protein
MVSVSMGELLSSRRELPGGNGETSCPDSIPPCLLHARRASRLLGAARTRRRGARAFRAHGGASYLASKVDVNVPLKVGHGREAGHVASVAAVSAGVRYAAWVDLGMVAIGR